jgi:hypothetical protein
MNYDNNLPFSLSFLTYPQAKLASATCFSPRFHAFSRLYGRGKYNCIPVHHHFPSALTVGHFTPAIVHRSSFKPNFGQFSSKKMIDFKAMFNSMSIWDGVALEKRVKASSIDLLSLVFKC